MEHRHIPASKDGSIPSAKTRFWRGEDNFLEGPEAKQLQQRNDRKSERSWWIRALIGWVIAAAVILLYLSLVVRRHP